VAAVVVAEDAATSVAVEGAAEDAATSSAANAPKESFDFTRNGHRGNPVPVFLLPKPGIPLTAGGRFGRWKPSYAICCFCDCCFGFDGVRLVGEPPGQGKFLMRSAGLGAGGTRE